MFDLIDKHYLIKNNWNRILNFNRTLINRSYEVNWQLIELQAKTNNWNMKFWTYQLNSSLPSDNSSSSSANFSLTSVGSDVMSTVLLTAIILVEFWGSINTSLLELFGLFFPLLDCLSFLINDIYQNFNILTN